MQLYHSRKWGFIKWDTAYFIMIRDLVLHWIAMKHAISCMKMICRTYGTAHILYCLSPVVYFICVWYICDVIIYWTNRKRMRTSFILFKALTISEADGLLGWSTCMKVKKWEERNSSIWENKNYKIFKQLIHNRRNLISYYYWDHRYRGEIPDSLYRPV